MKLRKLVTEMLIIAMCFGMAGCGSDKPEKSDDTDKNVAPTTQAGGDTTEPTEEPTKPTEAPVEQTEPPRELSPEEIAELAVSKYIGTSVAEDYILFKTVCDDYEVTYYEYDENWNETATYVTESGQLIETRRNYVASSLEEAKSHDIDGYEYVVYYNNGVMIYMKGRNFSDEYNEQGLLIKRELTNQTEEYEYDENGRVVKYDYCYDGKHQVTIYSWIDDNQYEATVKSQFDDGSWGGEVFSHKQKYSEKTDEYGRIISCVKEIETASNATKSVETYLYDEMGHLVEKTESNLQVFQYFYIPKSEYVAPDYK